MEEVEKSFALLEEVNLTDSKRKEKGNKINIIAQANSSKEWPYLRTSPDTINPIDHPMAIRIKKKEIQIKTHLQKDRKIKK